MLSISLQETILREIEHFFLKIEDVESLKIEDCCFPLWIYIEYFKSLLEVDLNEMQQFSSKNRKHWILDRTRSQRYVAVSF